jgi:hypothetical protein
MNLTLTAEKANVPTLQQRVSSVSSWLAAREHLVDFLVLAGVLLVVGSEIVPAHWTSIWMDREFTGWVAPIAGRFVDGQVLYTDGAHTPMPPLPVVLLRLLSARPTWLMESAANWLCQGLAIVAIYLAVRRDLPRPAALVAGLAAIPNFYSLPKTIAYDSMVQALVGVTCWQMLAHLRAVSESPTSSSLSAKRSLLFAAAATAASLLTKQSTGAGLLAGALAALLLARAPGWRRKLDAVVLYGLATAVTFLVLLLAMSPWASAPGFLQDVVLHGSEPKGGPAVMLDRARVFGAMMFEGLFSDGLFSLGVVGIALALPMARTLLRERRPLAGPGPRSSLGVTAAVAVSFVITVAVILVLKPRYPGRAIHLAPLLAILAVGAGRLLKPGKPLWRPHDALFACVCITLPAALAHNLSVETLRWTYDNNPLVVVALAVLAGAWLSFSFLPKSIRFPAVPRAALVMFFLTGLTSPELVGQWMTVQNCRSSWPEVAHLDGAKLPASAADLRGLVRRVRELTPATGDDVLLLPEDPNVQAWFDRPRPRLQCTIWFTDQCWDGFVDHDLQALKQHPPKVIVIGPRDYWRSFTHMLNPNSGVEELIDRLQRELLSVRYLRIDEHPISFQARREFMDIYVRK